MVVTGKPKTPAQSQLYLLGEMLILLQLLKRKIQLGEIRAFVWM